MSTPTVRTTFARLTPQETLLAMPGAGIAGPPSETTTATAREAIESVLLDALATPPCHILFSGGRDSSALLALAVHLARRHGLPEPVPVTVRHPGAPESDETRWQELVLEHVAVRDHVVLNFHDEQRLLGDVATTALRAHGPVWPESIQLHGAIYRHLDPGTIISGEGGDMVLDGHRMGAVRDALAQTRPRRRHLHRGVRALQPAVVRRRALASRRDEIVPPWLLPPAAQAYVREVLAMSAEPLRWDAATRAAMRTRPMAVFATNFDAAITEYGSRPVNPFTDLRVIDALARDAGPWGWGNRTALFRRLFHDVLPDAVLSRTSKASFNSTRWGPAERDFARDWDGRGFDPRWIDAEKLRASWLTDDPHPAADFLLHVAWAHDHGIPTGLEDNE